MSTSANSVNVSNIAPSTTETQLRDFFTFCGNIESIDYKSEEKKATIYFQKSNAAKTALMLNGGTLDGSHLEVTSDAVHEDEPHQGENVPHIEQSDKPRAGIAAEYLAKGYQLSDNILHRAIEMDQKQGISQKFLGYFHTLDTSLGARALGPDQTISGKVTTSLEAATQQAKAVDEQRGFSKLAHDYYEKALATPLGQKIKEFYTSTSKQVQDIHEEAKRINAVHKSEEVPADKPATQA
ncbi:hypothetical protein ONZ45_g2193 [Pleurotus djamor]|nr:hypothetical protein ONZ45_g2193 [Pleurotus djamor]